MRIANSELARTRAARGLTQKELGRLIGVTASTISSVENGNVRSWPKLRAACSQVLGVPAEDLFPRPEQRL